MNIEFLLGKTLSNFDIDNCIFVLEDGSKYHLYHSQDCCESVRMYDYSGNPKDLVGSPITQADEEITDEDPPSYTEGEHYDSYTWSIFTFSTAKGTVVIRWLGESNGYYSERVDFEQIK